MNGARSVPFSSGLSEFSETTGQSGLQYRRGRSKSMRGLMFALTAMSSDDSSLISGISNQSYTALLEYSQTRSHNVLWEDGLCLVTNPDDFRQCVLNFPAEQSSMDFEPTVLISSYERMSYYAIYFQVHDIEARGFSRQLIFLVADLRRNFIENFDFLYSEKVKDVLRGLHKTSVDTFNREFVSFVGSLKKTISVHNNVNLKAKLEELSRFGNVDDIPEGEEKPAEFFDEIRMEMRPLQLICNLGDVFLELNELLSDAMNSPHHGNIEAKGYLDDMQMCMEFGTNRRDNVDDDLIDDSENSQAVTQLSITDVLPNTIIHNCLFALMSGNTLVITSGQGSTEVANDLIQFVPFVNPRDYYENEIATLDVKECLKYSIVVIKDILGDTTDLPISILDLNDNIYQGVTCPPSSFIVKHIVPTASWLSGSLLLMTATLELKIIAEKFMSKLSEMMGRFPRRKSDFMDAITTIGFSIDDAPVLKYWVHCYFNETGLKPIMMYQSGVKRDAIRF